MAEFLFDYGLFLAKTATVVVAVGVVLVLMVASASRRKHTPEGLTIEKLNDKYRSMADSLRSAAMSKSEWRKKQKGEKKERKKAEKSTKDQEQPDKRIFVIHFIGDMRATGVTALREEVSAIAAVASDRDEVVVCLENSGGTVHEHGFGASQLLRLKDRNIPLTIIIDKVAASGGYLMASVADRLIAAPFAIIGSVGVVAQLPNFNRFLESHGIDFEQITAGKHKRTLTVFGKNTEEDRTKMREELEDVHELFKAVIAEHRPSLDVEAISTGEYWYGSRAKELGLVDELGSSDDYLMTATETAEVYSVCYKGRSTFAQRMQSTFASMFKSVGL